MVIDLDWESVMGERRGVLFEMVIRAGGVLVSVLQGVDVDL